MVTLAQSKSNMMGAAIIAAAGQAFVLGYLYATKKKKTKEVDENHEVAISLPDWAIDYYDSLEGRVFETQEEMMKVAVELSRRNVDEQTGGPFGTAIFKVEPTPGGTARRGTLFSIGVNRVVTLGNSTLHGEMVAIQMAQKRLGAFTLRGNGGGGDGPRCPVAGAEYHLYTSCEPCCMCLGATLWSGVSRIVCAATKGDAEAIGFDEGPVYPESYDALESAGCEVVRNVLQEEGAAVLSRYGDVGVIYNADGAR